jgi:hypothetical protein
MISNTQQISFYILRYSRLEYNIYAVHTDENSKKIDKFQKNRFMNDFYL